MIWRIEFDDAARSIMDQLTLRLRIQEKLPDGRLPHDHIPRPWRGPGVRETCDGCGEIVTKGQMIIEGVDTRGCRLRFHVACFSRWDGECQALGDEPSARLPVRSAFRAPGGTRRERSTS